MARRPVRRKDAPLFVEDETDEFRAALQRGDGRTVQDMLAGVAPEDATAWALGPLDAGGRTALHFAFTAPAEAHLQLVRLLCSRRADANAADAGGVTPLHLGAQRGSKFAVRALLCAGADNLRRTADGRSTVDFAACNPSPVELFEVVGWPGKGPNPRPLDPPRRRPDGQGAAEAQAATGPNLAAMDVAAAASQAAMPGATVATEGCEPLAAPLLLAALWFAFLGVAAALIIRNFS